MNEKGSGRGHLGIIIDITTHVAEVDQTLGHLARAIVLTATIDITTADAGATIRSTDEGESTRKAATKVATIVTAGERLMHIAQFIDVLVTRVTITGVRVILTMSLLDKAVADGHPVVFQVLYRLILFSRLATKTTRPFVNDHKTSIASNIEKMHTRKPGAPQNQVICILLITKGSFHLTRGYLLLPKMAATTMMPTMTFSSMEKKLMRKPSLKRKKRSVKS